MYVQLLTIQHLDLGGRQRTYLPGDWVDIGKSAALRLIALGAARSIQPLTVTFGLGCGVHLRAESAQARAVINRIGGIPVTVGEPRLDFAKTMLWSPKAEARFELAEAAFRWLDKWEIAVPLCSYATLAANIGSESDRIRTAEVIRDLRVPVYDTRLMFIRRTQATRELLRLWAAECSDGDERLAFLRALYRVKPLVLALPTTWVR